MIRISRAVCAVAVIALVSCGVRADEKQDLAGLREEIAKLKEEVAALKAENAALKAQLEAKGKPEKNDLPPVMELGGQASLGGYKYSVPANWTMTTPKDSKFAHLYRSPDKAGVILVQVKLKGAAPPEMAGKYSQSVIGLLKQDFVKNKTEVVDPPVAVKDPRFYLKVGEKIKVKGEKTANQMHLYQCIGKDMIECTVITTAEASDQVAATQRLAEEIVLSFKAEK